jgi:hypothetical protein
MRPLTYVALVVVCLEVIVALAALLGYRWLGGWEGAFLLGLIALILIALPWVGDLVVSFDSITGIASAHLAWWGRAVYELRPERRLRVHILGLRVRTSKPGRRASRRRERKPPPRGPRRLPHRLDQFIATVLVAGQTAHALASQARGISLTLQSPIGLGVLDRFLARTIGSRRLGKLQLRCLDQGERRVTFSYRIGLLRAALIAARFLAEGRPRRALRSERGG